MCVYVCIISKSLLMFTIPVNKLLESPTGDKNVHISMKNHY